MECQECGSTETTYQSASYTRANPSHEPTLISPAKTVCDGCGATIERHE